MVRRGESAGPAQRRVSRLAVVLLLVLLALWPLTFRYTSLGIDTESVHGQSVESRFYRLRWPGDGSLMVGWIDEHRPAAEGRPQSFDLGGLFLLPPRTMTPHSTWNRLGFWLDDVVAAHKDPPSEAAPRADRVMLVGVPHWLLVLLAGAVVAWQLARGRARVRGQLRATSR